MERTACTSRYKGNITTMPQESAILQEDDKLLGKLIGGALSYAPKKIIINGKTIFNPGEELLKEQGYKDVETSEAPAVSTQTQQAVSSWIEQKDKIIQSWELKPAQPDPAAALQEIQTQAIIEKTKSSEDKTLGIQCMALYPVYEQNKYHEAGEVALHPDTGYPKECMIAYDGTVQQGWTIDTATLWKPWHSRKPEYALPWEAPTGAHDIYKSGEYMIWTDGNIYKCVQDTNFSPSEYAQAWEVA